MRKITEKRTGRCFILPVAVAAMLAVVAFALLPGADSNDDGAAVGAIGDYNAGDIAVVNSIIDSNGLGWDPAPASGDVLESVMDTIWPGAVWSAGPTDRRLLRLNIHHKDLTGTLNVSGLTELTHLDCNDNGLTSLNIAGCLKLLELQCDGNGLTGTLNVSALTALQVLNCGSNGLTSLNVSGLTALRELYCMDNKLTSLDVSGLTALTKLQCNMNNLTSLNVSGLPALKEMVCTSNKLTSLTLSGLPALEGLTCNYNNLTSLTLSGLPALEYLSCQNNNNLTSLTLSGLPALKDLYCAHNKLTSLDVSGLSALRFLGCSDNSLTSLTLSGLPALITLECADNNLTTLDVSGLSALEYLVCGNNSLAGKLDVSAATALKSLYCAYNNLTALEVSSAHLTMINCSQNLMTSSTAVTGTGSITAFTAWDVGGFKFLPQRIIINIGNGDSVDDIQHRIQSNIDAKFCPVVTGTKTNADKVLVLDISSSVYEMTVYWNAIYSGPGAALELKGIKDFRLERVASMTLTSLKAENEVLVYGTLTVNGNVTIEGGGGKLKPVGGTVSVTGNVIAEGLYGGMCAVYISSASGSVAIGGSIVTSGIGIQSEAGNVTVGGNVTAGDYAIKCAETGTVHVKGNVSAPNRSVVHIHDEATVKIDGTATATDDSRFICYNDYLDFLTMTNVYEYLSRSDTSATNTDGYDSKYTDGKWSVFVGKQAGGGDPGDGGGGGGDPRGSGGDGGSNMLLIVAVIAVIAVAAGAAAYMLVIRPKQK